MTHERLTVSRVSDTPGIEYKATYYNGSESHGRYGSTKEDAIAKVRRQYGVTLECEEVTFNAYCGKFTDGEPVVLDASGAIELEADREHQRGIDAFVNDEVFDFSAQSIHFQEAYKDEWFRQTNPPNYGDYVDQYFSDHLDQLYWNYEAKQKADTKRSVESAARNFAAGIALAVLILVGTFWMVMNEHPAGFGTGPDVESR
jgi:hypothetical protein